MLSREELQRMTAAELLACYETGRMANPSSPEQDQLKMAILVRCTGDLQGKIVGLTEAVAAASSSGDALTKEIVALNQRMLWASWVMALAAVVGALVGIPAALHIIGCF